MLAYAQHHQLNSLLTFLILIQQSPTTHADYADPSQDSGTGAIQNKFTHFIEVIQPQHHNCIPLQRV